MVQVGIFPQLGGKLDAALFVRRDLHRRGVEHSAHIAALDQALLGNALGHLLKLLGGESRQTVVQPAGDKEGLPHAVPEFGGEIQPALGIDGVIILTHEHG